MNTIVSHSFCELGVQEQLCLVALAQDLSDCLHTVSWASEISRLTNRSAVRRPQSWPQGFLCGAVMAAPCVMAASFPQSL